MLFTGTHHVALCTPHFAALRQFYTETLELPVVGGFANRNIIFLDTGNTTIELIERTAPLESAQQGWAHFAFEVADIEATHAELVGRGIVFHVAPKLFPEENPAVKIAFFKDPDGNELELVERLAPGYPQP